MKYRYLAILLLIVFSSFYFLSGGEEKVLSINESSDGNEEGPRKVIVKTEKKLKKSDETIRLKEEKRSSLDLCLHKFSHKARSIIQEKRSEMDLVVKNIHGVAVGGDIYRFHYTPIEFQTGSSLKLIILKDGEEEGTFDKVELPEEIDSKTSRDKLFDFFRIKEIVLDETTLNYSEDGMHIFLRESDGSIQELELSEGKRKLECSQKESTLDCSCN